MKRSQNSLGGLAHYNMHRNQDPSRHRNETILTILSVGLWGQVVAWSRLAWGALIHCELAQPKWVRKV